MSDIIRIVITGSSSWGLVSKAYHGKITIEQYFIQYEYTPVKESDLNPSQKWLYQTTSPLFQELFQHASDVVADILNWDNIEDCTDIGVTTFTVTYSDMTEKSRSFIQPSDMFKACFTVIKPMVPKCEQIPAVLRTSEDRV